jgi:hypothetical protein
MTSTTFRKCASNKCACNKSLCSGYNVNYCCSRDVEMCVPGNSDSACGKNGNDCEVCGYDYYCYNAQCYYNGGD